MASTCDCCGHAIGVGTEIGGYYSEGKTADSGCECTAGRCRNCKQCEVHCDCPPEWRDFPEEEAEKNHATHRCPQCNCTWNQVVGVMRLKTTTKELRKCRHCGKKWEVSGGATT